MLHLKKFIKYVPAPSESNELLFNFIEKNNISIVFYRDECGRDWYEALPSFDRDTIKVAYDKTGVVRDFNKDASAIVPDGLSVMEINGAELPTDFDRLGNWVVDNGDIVPCPIDYVGKAIIKKSEFLKSANENIEIIQDAKLLGMVTDAEEQALVKWREFRILISRIDVNDAPEIVWPTAPGD